MGRFNGFAPLTGGANVLTVTAADVAGNATALVRSGTRHGGPQLNVSSLMSGITHTLLTSGTDSTNHATYTTASIAPAANALITVAVLGRRGNGAQTPTVTGGGMATWTRVASIDYEPDDFGAWKARVTVFRALSNAPGSGALTIEFPNTQSNATWIVSQWSGVDTSGVNGAGAIVQTVSARGDAVSSLAATLAAFGKPNNAAYGVVGAGLSGPARSSAYALDAGTGTVVWKVDIPSGCFGAVTYANGVVFFPTISGTAYALNAADGHATKLGRL